MLKLRNIYKSYKIGATNILVLKGINFDVNPGDMLAITGTSGSGKSTLMNIIGLLDHPSSGKYSDSNVFCG
jgi:putative ABC transport system ATP-binding protein